MKNGNDFVHKNVLKCLKLYIKNLNAFLNSKKWDDQNA